MQEIRVASIVDGSSKRDWFEKGLTTQSLISLKKMLGYNQWACSSKGSMCEEPLGSQWIQEFLLQTYCLRDQQNQKNLDWHYSISPPLRILLWLWTNTCIRIGKSLEEYIPICIHYIALLGRLRTVMAFQLSM